MARDNAPWAGLDGLRQHQAAGLSIFGLLRVVTGFTRFQMLIMDLSMACEELLTVFIKYARCEPRFFGGVAGCVENLTLKNPGFRPNFYLPSC
jgi:hypothetical protein